MKSAIIIEGISGAGKSKVIAEIQKIMAGCRAENLEVIYEDTTYGELMDELNDASKTDLDRCKRLESVYDELIAPETGKFFIIERFHPSYYAVMPEKDLYEMIDDKMAALGFKLVLLSYSDEKLYERAFNHKDGGPGLAERIEAYFGGAEAALNKFVDSKRKREEYLKFTHMDHTIIMTDEMKWAQYAIKILEFVGFEFEDCADSKTTTMIMK
jgi:thymidylate kinase